MQILSRILSCMGFFTQIDKKDLEKNFNEVSDKLLNLKEFMSDINQNIASNQMNFMQSFSDMQKDTFFKISESLEANREIAAKTQILEENITSIIKKYMDQQHEDIMSMQKLCQEILENSNIIKDIINNVEKIKLTQLNKSIIDNHMALSTNIINIAKEQTTCLKEIKTYSEKESEYFRLQKKQDKEMMEFLKESFLQQDIKMANVRTFCENIVQNNDRLRDILLELNKNKMTKDDLDIISSFLRLLAANQLMQSASNIVKNQDNYY